MTNPPQVSEVTSKPPARWWPAVFFLGLTAAAILWVRVFWDVHQQDRNIWTYLLCGVCFLCLLLWLLVLSRLPWRTRWLSLGVVLLVHVLVIAAVRIKGVDGDLVPVVEWRWKCSSTQVATHAPAPSDQTPEAPDLVLPDGWPQFLGPHRNGQVEAIHWETDWSHHPPEELWRIPLGAAWSGFAVAEGLAVTQEQRGPDEVVSCFDALTGRRLWTHAYAARYANTIAGEGPRATATIDEDRVYAVGATGWLTCLELRTGTVVWAKNVVEECGGTVPVWGYSVSPLVAGNRVILSVGGTDGRSLLALDKHTGHSLWAAGKDQASYSSPILAELGGLRHVVVFNYSSVAGHELESGRLLWEQPYSRAQVHVAAPLVLGGDRVLFSSGYGQGSTLYAIHREEEGNWSADLVWKSRRMKAKFCNLVEHGGFIYGLDDGILACISAETGELQWKDGRYGHGQVILAGGHLLVLAESGELVLIEPNPEEWIERFKVRIFSGKTWNPPALTGKHLYLRTDQEAVCLRLTLEKP
jgi:outer membrane protein assembly factor BamB